VITAAHCFNAALLQKCNHGCCDLDPKNDNYTVLAGTHAYQSLQDDQSDRGYTDLTSRQIIRVKKLCRHPNHESDDPFSGSDIAVLILETPLKVTDNVKRNIFL